MLFVLIYLFSIFSLIFCDYNVSISNRPRCNVSENFLTLALGTDRVNTGSWKINLTFMTPLAKAFSPTNLRFGGTDADNLIFQENSTSQKNFFNFYGPELDELYQFANSSGLRLIFDLNIGLRADNNSVNGKWNSSNAEKLLDYASSKGYDMDFELGNEPDYLYFPNNTILSGAQIADDYKTLRNMLNSNSRYKNSKLVGPSVVSTESGLKEKQETIMTDFLNNGGGNAVDALAFHYYYMYGPNATLLDFLNVTVLDWFARVTTGYKSLNYTPLVITETSSTWGGGTPNISNTYAAGFLWLDKLGVCALGGLSWVARHDFYGGWYGLLGFDSMPLPDYWLSLIYKKVVGTQVFNVTIQPIDPNLRIYASSSKNSNGLVVYGQTMSNDSYIIDFPQITNKQANVYILQEGEHGNLVSPTSRLNGNLTNWIPHYPGPRLVGNVMQMPIAIPGYSQFFVVVGIDTPSQCPSGWLEETTSTKKCFKMAANTQPLFSARLDCDTFGFNTSLLSIESAFENADILKHLNGTQCSQLFLGLIRSGNDFVWDNGNGVSYRNWKSGFPSNDNNQNCVVMNSGDGTWENTDCDQPQCYICQMNI